MVHRPDDDRQEACKHDAELEESLNLKYIILGVFVFFLDVKCVWIEWSPGKHPSTPLPSDPPETGIKVSYGYRKIHSSLPSINELGEVFLYTPWCNKRCKPDQWR